MNYDNELFFGFPSGLEITNKKYVFNNLQVFQSSLREVIRIAYDEANYCSFIPNTSGALQFNNHLLPLTAATYNLGSATQYWNQVFAIVVANQNTSFPLRLIGPPSRAGNDITLETGGGGVKYRMTGTGNHTFSTTGANNIINSETCTLMVQRGNVVGTSNFNATINAGGTTVTLTSGAPLLQDAFTWTNLVKVGDTLTISGETQTITAINSDTLVTTTPWTTAPGAGYVVVIGPVDYALFVRQNGQIALGSNSPTAFLNLRAGTANANQAPLKFVSGTNLTIPEDGAVEYNGTHLYFTAGSTRYQIDQQVAASAPSLTSTQIAFGDVSNLMTSSATLAWDNTNNILTVTRPSIGTATLNGLLLQNSTLSTSSVTSQNAPTLILRGHGWRTFSSGSDNIADWFFQPIVTGNANPIGAQLLIGSSLGGGITNWITLGPGSTTINGSQITMGGFLVAPNHWGGGGTSLAAPIIWNNSMELFASIGHLQIDRNGALQTDRNYMLYVGGEALIFGGTVISQVTAPTLTASYSGAVGAATYKYKVIATLINGTTTDASPEVTGTSAGVSTLGGNVMLINVVPVRGAYQYKVYRTVAGGTGSSGTTGIIATFNQTAVGNSTALFDNGGAGDGTTPPTVNTTGNLGVGLTSPTAYLHLKGGVDGARGAPLKFTSGTNLTALEDGAVEYNGTHLYITIGSTRYQLDQQVAGSAPTLSQNQIAFGDASNLMTSSGSLYFTASTLNVPSIILLSGGNISGATQQFTGLSTITRMRSTANVHEGNMSINSGGGLDTGGAGGQPTSVSTSSGMLFAGAASVAVRVSIRGIATADLSAIFSTAGVNHSYTAFEVGQMDVKLAASGIHALLAQQVIKPLTVTTNGTSTVTNTATLYIEGASTGATNNFAMWVAAGIVRFDGNTILSDATTISPSAKLHVISTTEQVRIAYDASNYYSTTVSSAGAVTYNAVGASQGFTFNQNVIPIGGFQTNATMQNSNLAIPTSATVGAQGLTGTLAFAGATTVSSRRYMRGSSSTSITAGNSYGGTIFGQEGATVAASGTHLLFANVVIKPLVITTGAGGALTNSASLYVEDAATNATNNYAVWIDAGRLRIDDNVAAPSTIAAGTITNRYGGATNFLGDPTIWLRININGTDYKIPCYT